MKKAKVKMVTRIKCAKINNIRVYRDCECDDYEECECDDGSGVELFCSTGENLNCCGIVEIGGFDGYIDSGVLVGAIKRDIIKGVKDDLKQYRGLKLHCSFAKSKMRRSYANSDYMNILLDAGFKKQGRPWKNRKTGNMIQELTYYKA